jgi:hypothetical protein
LPTVARAVETDAFLARVAADGATAARAAVALRAVAFADAVLARAAAARSDVLVAPAAPRGCDAWVAAAVAPRLDMLPSRTAASETPMQTKADKAKSKIFFILRQNISKNQKCGARKKGIGKKE